MPVNQGSNAISPAEILRRRQVQRDMTQASRNQTERMNMTTEDQRNLNRMLETFERYRANQSQARIMREAAAPAAAAARARANAERARANAERARVNAEQARARALANANQESRMRRANAQQQRNIHRLRNSNRNVTLRTRGAQGGKRNQRTMKKSKRNNTRRN